MGGIDRAAVAGRPLKPGEGIKHMALISGIRGVLVGKKTYLVALVALVTAALDWSSSGGGAHELINAAWGPIAAMTVRAGIAKGR